MKGYFSADNLHFNFMFESNKILDRWHIHGFLIHEVGFFVDWLHVERERDRRTDQQTGGLTDRQTGEGSDNEVSVDTIDRNRHLNLTKRFIKGQHSFTVVCTSHSYRHCLHNLTYFHSVTYKMFVSGFQMNRKKIE